VAIVGSAFVEIHAITTAVQRELREGLTVALQGEGVQLGEQFSRDFGGAARAGLSGPLAAMSDEVKLAFTGAASGVSTLTEATIRAEAAQRTLTQTTRTAVDAELAYTKAAQDVARTMLEEVPAIDRTAVASEAAARAKVTAAETSRAAAQTELESLIAVASTMEGASAKAAQAVVEEARVHVTTAEEIKAAALSEQEAAVRTSAAWVESAALTTTATQEAAAAVLRGAEEVRTTALVQVEAARTASVAAKEAAASEAASAGAAAKAQEEAAAASKKSATEQEASAAKGTKNVEKVSKGIVEVAAVVAGASIDMAAKFQSSTERLVTSAGENQGNLDMVRKGILDIAGQVGYSAEQLSAAMYKIESGGQHGAAGLAVLKAAGEGAKTENADLTVVSDALTSALTDYHLPATAAADVTSKLVAATSQGKMTFQDLAGSMSAVLPIASQNHVSLNDILGDLASMTVHGISAQQATQNLSDVINHMAKPTAVQSAELATLGMNSQNLSTDLGTKGLSGTLEEISVAIQKGMGPGSTKTIVDLQTALKGLPPSVQELGTKLLEGTISYKDYVTTAKSMDPIAHGQAMSFGTMANQFYKIGTQQVTGVQAMQSYSAAMGRATGDATGLKVAVMLTGENMDTTHKAIGAVSNASAEAGGHVLGWSKIQSTFNVSMSRFKDGLGAAAISLGTKLLPALTTLANMLSDGLNYLEHHKAAAEALGVVLGVVVAGAATALAVVMGGKLIKAFKAVEVAMKAVGVSTPWMIAITALIVITVEIIAHWSQVKAFFLAIWKDVKSALDSSGVTAAFKSIGTFFVTAFNDIKGAATAVINFMKTWGTTILAVIAPVIGIPILIAQHWDEIVTFFHGLWSRITGFFSTWGPTILGVLFPFIGIPVVIYQHWGQIVQFMEDVWHKVTAAVSSGISASIKFLEELPGKTAYALGHFAGTMIRLAIEGGEGLLHGIERGWVAAYEFIVTIPARTKAGLLTLASTIVRIAVDAWQGFTHAIVTGWADTYTFVASIPTKIKNALINLSTNIVQIAVGAWHDFTSAIVVGWGGTYTFVSSIPDKVKNALINFSTTIVQIAVSAWQGFTRAIVVGWGDTYTFLASIPSKIKNAFAGATVWLLEVGHDILHGLVNGLLVGVEAVYGFFRGLVNKFLSGFKDALGVHSPSTVFATIGGDILRGLLNGLMALGGVVTSFITSLGAAIVSAFTASINFLKTLWSDFWRGLQVVAQTVFNAVLNVITEVWSRLTNGFNNDVAFLKNIWDDLWNGIRTVATGVWNAVSSFLTDAVTTFINWFKRMWDLELQGWVNIWNAIHDTAINLWNTISEFLTGAVNTFITFFTTIWNNEVTNWTRIWNTIHDTAINLWNTVVGFLTNAVNAFISFFETIWNNEVTNWTRIWNTIHDVAINLWNTIRDFLTNEFNNFSNFFRTLWTDIQNVFTAVWNFMHDTAVNIWNVIRDFLTAAFNGFMQFFKDTWTNIQNAFQAVWNFIHDVAVNVWNTIRDFLTNAFDVFKQFFSDTWNNIKQDFINIWDVLRNTAVNAWNGIKAFFDGAFTTFKQFFSDTWHGIVTDFENIWNSITGIASKIWGDVKQKFADGINTVIGIINKFAGAINGVAGAIGISLNLHIEPLADGGPVIARQLGGTIEMKEVIKRADGGGVSGQLAGYAPGHDTIPAMAGRQPYILAGGEYIVRPEATRAMGPAAMSAINNAHRKPLGVTGLAEGGFVLPDAIASAHMPFLQALTAGQPEAREAASSKGFASGGFIVPEGIAQRNLGFFTALRAGRPDAIAAAGGPNLPISPFSAFGLAAGGAVQDRINQAQGFAQSMAGKPYIWGGTGPDGMDCSGFTGAVTHVLRGEDPYSGRLGTTNTMPWPGFVESSEKGTWALGWNSEHMAGTLAGVNIESGSTPIKYPGVEGSDAGIFPNHAFLPEIGDAFTSGGGGRSTGVGAFLKKVLGAAARLALMPVRGALNEVGDHLGYPGKFAVGATNKLLDALVSKSDASDAASGAGGGGPGNYSGPIPGGDAVGRWRGLVDSTLVELGMPVGLDDKVLRQIATESGGDPNATQGNIGDVNNASGDLAKGLMQVIGTTFRAHAGPYVGLGQYDPHASIYAGLDYARGRYGPDLSFLGQGHGYNLGGMIPQLFDSGGWLMPGVTQTVNASGAPEAIIPDPIQSFKTAMIDVFSQLAPQFVTALTSGSQTQIAALGAQLLTSGTHVVETIGPALVTSVGTQITTLGAQIITAGVHTAETIGSTIQAVVVATGPAIATVGDKIHDTIATIQTAFRPIVPVVPGFDALKQIAPDLAFAINAGSKNQIIEFGDKLLSSNATLPASLSDGVRAAVAAAKGSAYDYIPDIMERIRALLGALPANVQSVVSAVQNVAVIAQTTIATAIAASNPPAASTLPAPTNVPSATGQLVSQGTAALAPAAATTLPVPAAITFHDGAFQVTIQGTPDSVTIAELHDTLQSWSQQILHDAQGRTS